MKRKILFLLPPQANLMDFGSAVHAFTEAIFFGLEAEIKYCSYEDNITSSVMLPFGKLDSYKKHKLNQGDILIISSLKMSYAISKQFKPPKEVLHWIVDQYDRHAKIVAICSGAFFLAKTGLLEGKKCTTHWKRIEEFKILNPKAIVQENILFIEDENIVTSAGAGSGVDVALHLIKQIKGDYFAYKVSRELIVFNRRSGNEPQYSESTLYRNHFHQGIHRVQDWLNENLDKKKSVEELAEIANMSYRNFCRIFKKETELTPLEYITKLRQEKAQELMKKPDYSRSQIANMVGLDSERQLYRILAVEN